MKLSPRTIFAAGIAGTGKTTTFKELAEMVDNAVYLARDTAAQQILTVDPESGLAGKFPETLQPFADYVEEDPLAKNASSIQTPFGPRLRIGQRTAYNARHGIDPCDLTTYAIAADNLQAGKVPLIDSLTPRRFKAGEVEKVMQSDFFQNYPTSLVFFHFSDTEAQRQRILERGETDSYARTRVEYEKAQDPKTFREYVADTQRDFTDNLSGISQPIFWLDVLGKTPDQCAHEIICNYGK